MRNTPFISICIPAYNRPIELSRLLKTIDYTGNDLEIVLCEDNSPKRKEIRSAVKNFKRNSLYTINYIENKLNYGYDANLRQLIKHAHGKYIIFMGDDDGFMPKSLNYYVDFLKKNQSLGYILKAHLIVNQHGKKIPFKYYPKNKFFPKGSTSYLALFRKGVFISGFTFQKNYLSKEILSDNRFDGTLLYQLYLLAELTLNYPAAYVNKALTIRYLPQNSPMFGSSVNEKDKFTPGEVSISNSINFVKGFRTISEFIDKKYGLHLNKKILNDLAKYSFYIFSQQRERSIIDFIKYVIAIKKIGIWNKYAFFYVLILLFFGKKFSESLIDHIKIKANCTPRL